MKCGRQNFALAHEDRMAGAFREYFHTFTNGFDNRRANENHFDGCRGNFCVSEVNVAGELASIAVSQNGDIEERERFLRGAVYFACEENGSGARPEKCAAIRSELFQGIEEAFFGHYFQVRDAFTARQNHARNAFQVFRAANVGVGNADAVKHFGVSFVVTLNREYADVHVFFVQARISPLCCGAFSGALTSRGFASNPLLQAGEYRGPSSRHRALRRPPAQFSDPCSAWWPSRWPEHGAPDRSI